MSTNTAPRPDRPRDLARQEGIACLSDRDLLALVLGQGGRGQPIEDVADAVLAQAGGLVGLPRAGPALLGEVAGLGPAKALRLGATVEIGRRIARRQASSPEPLTSPDRVAAWFAPRVAGLDHERMWVVSVDGRSRVRGVRRVAQGGRHGLVVTAREILSAALADAASAFLLVHNHPSGSPEPSAADVRMTESVAQASEVVGVPLLDHVVVTAAGDYCSLLEAGLLVGTEAQPE
ncbi:MAG: DNA repair protein RadC [Polyangiaceae bacterium]